MPQDAAVCRGTSWRAVSFHRRPASHVGHRIMTIKLIEIRFETSAAAISANGAQRMCRGMPQRASACRDALRRAAACRAVPRRNVTSPQKEALLEAINSAQEGIEKLRKELVAYNKTLRQMQDEAVARSLSRLQLAQVNAKKPKTREEAQKEILDAELDMFTKQQEGQDVTELQKKISELRRQMTIQFPPHPAMRRPHSSYRIVKRKLSIYKCTLFSRGGRFNTATRFTRGAPSPKVFVNQSVDHRPRALLISGFEADELDALTAHFAQFGEITHKETNLAVPELIVVYKARAHAEQAAHSGKHYNDRTLSITWVTNTKALSGVNAVAAPAPAPTTNHNGDANHDDDKMPETPTELNEDSLLRFDEEEDEDAEDRSWRR
ncbi:zinc finger protein swm-like [Hyposmocoma kahamanoa]|uniref:zinc finger protein swm-like n=1 Tax=Hyposmocoma kahamanoa TaxID=1477025 RepID=UPI000E6D86E8|nr:zinc finger protein swm-like [Hyposmocoma kahamanoa]